MKKWGLILLAMVTSLSLLAGSALARSDVVKGSGKGSQVKAKSEVRERAEKHIQNRVDSMSRDQKQKITERLKERQKQSVKRQFTDAGQHWAGNRIQKAQALGLISGYEDGTFKPDEPVTAAEAMVMAVSLAENLSAEGETTNPEGTTGEGTTADPAVEEGTEGEGSGEESSTEVPGWAKEKVRKAAALKIINVNRFHSQVQATRAQAAVMLAKAYGLQPAEVSEGTFGDASLISPEDIGYILALKEAGIVKGSPDGKFNPNSSITRAEIAAMLANMVDVVENEETGTGTGGETSDGTDSQGTQPAGTDTTGETTQGGITDQTSQTSGVTGTEGQSTGGGTGQ
ncbi:MAG: S-layer homology domain-containing protein [Desulfocucumaceae bacterium]